MSIIVIIALLVLMIFVDFVPLVKYKQTKTAIVFGLFFIGLITYILLPSFGVKMPSIIVFLDNFLDLIGLHY